MKTNIVVTPLKELLQPIIRQESVEADQTYNILGAHWYADGLYTKEIKTGVGIQADKIYRVEEGDFVYNRLFAWKGSFAVASSNNHNCYVSNEFPTFKINQGKINPTYLWRYFSRQTAWDEALGLSSGGTPTSRNRLKEEKLLAMEIPLPPIEEQRHIVARIEELAAKIEEARGLRREAMEATEIACARIISNLEFKQKDWTKVQAAVLDKKGSVRSGPFGSQLHHEEFVESGVAAIGTRDVQVNQFKLNSGWYVDPEKFEEFKRYQVFPGDVLGTIVGGSIGRFCVTPDDVPLAFSTKHIMALTLNQNKSLPEFLSYMLNFHIRSRKSLFAQSEGSAQPSLNSFKILNTEIPLPSLDQQRHIISYLDVLSAKIKKISQLQSQTSAELNALLPSILDKAFKGEL